MASLLGAYTAISTGGGGSSSNEMSDKDAEVLTSVFSYETLIVSRNFKKINSPKKSE